jgi:hypothetical protein
LAASAGSLKLTKAYIRPGKVTTSSTGPNFSKTPANNKQQQYNSRLQPQPLQGAALYIHSIVRSVCWCTHLEEIDDVPDLNIIAGIPQQYPHCMFLSVETRAPCCPRIP